MQTDDCIHSRMNLVQAPTREHRRVRIVAMPTQSPTFFMVPKSSLPNLVGFVQTGFCKMNMDRLLAMWSGLDGLFFLFFLFFLCMV